MDVVADTSAIGSGIVCPEHVQVGQMTTRNSLNVRHQVIWDTLGVFSDQARLVSTNRVKVPKANCREISILRDDSVFQYLLNHCFSLSIRIGGLNWFVFGAIFLLAVQGSG